MLIKNIKKQKHTFILYCLIILFTPFSLLCKEVISSGTIQYHYDHLSPQLNNKRMIKVYLPPGYKKNIKKSYPVLYIHDGQMVFTNPKLKSTTNQLWRIDKTTDYLINTDKIQKIIIVSIYSTADKFNEYTPFQDKKKGGGKADQYLNYIVNTIKPFIDKTYRTLPDKEYTAICGTHLGGLVSLYAVYRYADIFSKAGILSPTLNWADHQILKIIQRSQKIKAKIYLDIGTKEKKDKFHLVRTLRNILKRKGYEENKDYVYYQIKKANYRNPEWSNRLKKMLLFFYRK